MHHNLVWFVATVLTLTWSQGRAGDTVQDDLGKLKGTWIAVKANQDGKELEADKTAKVKLVFNGQKFSLDTTGTGAGEGTFTIDPTKKPKFIDLTGLDPEENKITVPGIYQIDGDTLKMAQPTVDLKRPTNFDGKTGVSVLVLKRQKEKAK